MDVINFVAEYLALLMLCVLTASTFLFAKKGTKFKMDYLVTGLILLAVLL